MYRRTALSVGSLPDLLKNLIAVQRVRGRPPGKARSCLCSWVLFSKTGCVPVGKCKHIHACSVLGFAPDLQITPVFFVSTCPNHLLWPPQLVPTVMLPAWAGFKWGEWRSSCMYKRYLLGPLERRAGGRCCWISPPDAPSQGDQTQRQGATSVLAFLKSWDFTASKPLSQYVFPIKRAKWKK